MSGGWGGRGIVGGRRGSKYVIVHWVVGYFRPTSYIYTYHLYPYTHTCNACVKCAAMRGSCCTWGGRSCFHPSNQSAICLFVCFVWLCVCRNGVGHLLYIHTHVHTRRGKGKAVIPFTPPTTTTFHPRSHTPTSEKSAFGARSHECKTWSHLGNSSPSRRERKWRGERRSAQANAHSRGCRSYIRVWGMLLVLVLVGGCA